MPYLILFITYGTVLIEWLTTQRGVVLIPYGIVNPLLAFIPRALYYSTLKGQVTRRWLSTLELLIVFMLLINAPASLWWHEMGFQYDRFLHFGAAFLAVPILVLLIGGFRRSLSAALRPTLILMFIALFAWEGFQYTSDILFGTQLFHDSVQSIQRDFTEDIIFGALGIITALPLIRHLVARTTDYIA